MTNKEQSVDELIVAYFATLSRHSPDDVSRQAPFGLSVPSLLLIYIVVLLFTPCVEWNSAPVKSGFISMGVFACPEGTPLNDNGTCDAQNMQLNLLMDSHLWLSFLLGGFFLQVLKQRYISVVGYSLGTVGCLLKLLLKYDFCAWAAMVLLSTGHLLCHTGMSHISRLFPRRQGTMLGMLGMAVACSSYVGTVEYKLLLRSYSSYLWLQCLWAVVHATGAALMFLLTPVVPYTSVEPISMHDYVLTMEPFRLLRSKESVLFIVYNSMAQLRTYYLIPMSFKTQSMIFSPMDMFTCFIMGIIFDRWGVWYVVTILNLSIIISLSFTLFDVSGFAETFGLASYIISGSWVVTLVNAYAFGSIPGRFTCRVAGLIYFISGLITMAGVLVMTYFSQRGFNPTCELWILSVVLQIPISQRTGSQQRSFA
ncbi:MAG: hypothetical protein KVP17_004249 [Porospora cf. gigantea B]|uniref:uncharacterized protein n=1 Tax=Porospora cf. gigantea B TaxID=2853592 RepID=UPI003571AC4C|nr:MAG: hypothetical protein KVP17_004249 [Porospora cf. gigantea B]